MVRRFPARPAHSSRYRPLLIGNALCTRSEDGVVWPSGRSRLRYPGCKGVARGLAESRQSWRSFARSCTSWRSLRGFTGKLDGAGAADSSSRNRRHSAEPSSVFLAGPFFSLHIFPPAARSIAHQPLCLHCELVIVKSMRTACARWVCCSFRRAGAAGLHRAMRSSAEHTADAIRSRCCLHRNAIRRASNKYPMGQPAYFGLHPTECHPRSIGLIPN
jgi:hypothetical protein